MEVEYGMHTGWNNWKRPVLLQLQASNTGDETPLE
jgi:hypothetical protein